LLIFAYLVRDGFDKKYITRNIKVTMIKITTIHMSEKLFTNALPDSNPKYSNCGRGNSELSQSVSVFRPGMSLNGMKLNEQVVAFRDDK